MNKITTAAEVVSFEDWRVTRNAEAAQVRWARRLMEQMRATYPSIAARHAEISLVETEKNG